MGDEIRDLRDQIDDLDSALIALLSKRMQASREIGELKKKAGLPTLDKERWETLIEKCVAVGLEKGLSKKYISELFDIIHRHSIEEQENT